MPDDLPDPDDPSAPKERDVGGSERAPKVTRITSEHRGQCEGCGARRWRVAGLHVAWSQSFLCRACATTIRDDLDKVLRYGREETPA